MIKSLPQSTQAAVWALVSCLCGAIMISIVKHLSSEINSSVLVFWRNLFGLIIFLPYIVRQQHRMSFKTSAFSLYLLRGVIGLFAMLLWYYALADISLSNAVALNFTAPLFASLAAIIILKEQMGLHRWSALLIGFTGAILILRPDSGVLETSAILVIIASFLWGVNAVVIKLLTKTESSRNIVFYMSLVMTPLSLPFALPFWEWPTASLWPWIIGLGIASTISQWALSIAMSKADLTAIIPYDFSRLVFTALIAYVAFSEIIAIETIIGAIIILGSACYIARREARMSRHKTMEIAEEA